MISDISFDFETKSTIELPKVGVYVYAECPHTDVWCLAFKAPEDADVSLWTPGDALRDSPTHQKLVAYANSVSRNCRAWNAAFERIIWREIMVKRYGLPEIALARWVCTAAEAAALSLPRALENAARVLGCAQQKDNEGHRIMLQVCRPRNSAKLKNGIETKPIWWGNDEGKLDHLFRYCKQDVRTEIAVAEKIRRLTASEREAYLLDQRINDRGVLIDLPLIETMKGMSAYAISQTNKELRAWTKGKVDKVTKPKDIVQWLNELQFDEDEVLSIAKDKIELLLARDDLPEAAREVLKLRMDAGKSSVSKLKRMVEYACRDLRMRGLLLFHGAGTGRWSGKGPQVQNFPARSYWLSVDKDLVEHYLPLVRAGDIDRIELVFPLLEVLALSLRACLRAAPGKKFVGGDFAAIEARVLAWLAGQDDLIALFAKGADVYKPLAAQIYDVPVSEVTKSQRDMGKRARLGCGFGMGAEKFVATAWKEGRQIISLEFAEHVIEVYRDESDKITALWRELNNAALEAVRNPGRVVFAADGKLRFSVRGEFLWIVLPSGKRMLAYHRPVIRSVMTPWGEKRDTVFFWGENSTTKQWTLQKSYGGFWAENVTQAAARDLMLEAMFRAEEHKYSIVLTCHDELLSEVDESFGSVKEFESLMIQRPTWAPSLPIAAECEERSFYGK
ncbi:MAG TPA: DNA polymerase [Gemmatimonadaceae bacterium]|nr:DNA polymerase [Gemmatimonadaceae bacterium]